MTLGLVLIQLRTGFGRPYHNEFGIGQALIVLRTAALGTTNDLSGTNWREGDDAAVSLDTHFPDERIVAGSNGRVTFRASDSRVIGISRSRSDRLTSPSSPAVPSRNHVKRFLDSVVAECGYPLETEIVQMRPSVSEGKVVSLDVDYRPVWGGVPFDSMSFAKAEIECPSGRLRFLAVFDIPRLPESLTSRFPLVRVRSKMVSELRRFGIKDETDLQRPRLVITVRDPKRAPAGHLAWMHLAWEKCPASFVAYEGVFKGRAPKKGAEQVIARVFVDAQNGRVLRSEFGNRQGSSLKDQ